MHIPTDCSTDPKKGGKLKFNILVILGLLSASSFFTTISSAQSQDTLAKKNKFDVEIYDQTNYPHHVFYSHDSLSINRFTIINTTYKIIQAYKYPPQQSGKKTYTFDRSLSILLDGANIFVDTLTSFSFSATLVKTGDDSYSLSSNNRLILIKTDEDQLKYTEPDTLQFLKNYNIVAQ